MMSEQEWIAVQGDVADAMKISESRFVARVTALEETVGSLTARLDGLEAAMPGKTEPQATAGRVQRRCFGCRAELTLGTISHDGDVICIKCIAKQRNDNAETD